MSLQLWTGSTHAPNYPHVLYSQLADFELHLEILTDCVERLAEILEDVLESASDVFEVPILLHRANFFSEFPVRLLRHCSSSPIEQLDETSNFALLFVREHTFLPTIPLWTFSWLVQLQH